MRLEVLVFVHLGHCVGMGVLSLSCGRGHVASGG
jgi:hypothetical protein